MLLVKVKCQVTNQYNHGESQALGEQLLSLPHAAKCSHGLESKMPVNPTSPGGERSGAEARTPARLGRGAGSERWHQPTSKRPQSAAPGQVT